MSQDHQTPPLPLLILTPTVNVTKFAGHRRREVACRSCPAELLRNAGILRKGSRLFSLMETGGSFALSSAHTPHRRPTDTVDHAVLWSGLHWGRRRMRSASSPTEHGDLLTPRGVWTCRMPERLCLGGQGESSTCSGIGFFFLNRFSNFSQCKIPIKNLQQNLFHFLNSSVRVESSRFCSCICNPSNNN